MTIDNETDLSSWLGNNSSPNLYPKVFLSEKTKEDFYDHNKNI